MSAVISISGLRKSYGATVALDGLDLEVPPGEAHGLLGPNGAGKTTTIRILLGLLRADTGTVELFGADPWAEPVELHRRLAYVPGDVELWPNLTGGEVIDLLGRLRGGLDMTKRDHLIDRFELDPTKKGRTYSKGNRQKVALVAALASRTELLLLDEPTAGLDPLMEKVFQDEIARAKQEGTSVFLSSHILAQVEKLCDTISIVRQGRVVEAGTLSEMRHLTRTTIEAEVAQRADEVAGLEGVHNVTLNGTRVRLDVDGAHLDETIRYLANLGIRSLVSNPPTLEELMLRHYGDQVDVSHDSPAS